MNTSIRYLEVVVIVGRVIYFAACALHVRWMNFLLVIVSLLDEQWTIDESCYGTLVPPALPMNMIKCIKFHSTQIHF